MKRRDFNKNLSLIGLAAPLFPSLVSAKKTETEQNFEITVGDSKNVLPAAGAFNLKTNPAFVIWHNGKKEILSFDSELQLQTKNPKKNRSGHRSVDVDLKTWEGKAYSQLLGKEIGFRVTNTHKSKLTSKVLNQDFPSALELNIEYDILINGQVVKKGISGRVSTHLDTFIPSVDTIFQVEGGSVNLSNQNTEVIFFAA
ncbi:MAG: hypothetical protein ACOVOQ_01710 [Flavobacterium sp.]